MAIGVIDLLEVIDIEHEAYQATAVTARTREFFYQPHLQIAAVVPACQYIRKSAAQQAGAVNHILECE